MLSDNSVVDSLVHAVHHDGEEEAEDGPDVLEVDPSVHELVVLLEGCGLGISSKDWLVHDSDEPADVDGEADSNEVVHLEEETEGTLLHLVDLREKLNELVHTLHAEVDEHEPVDVLHVGGSVLVVGGSRSLILGLDEVHCHELQLQGDDGETESDTHTDELVEHVEVVVSSSLDPDTFVSTKELSLGSGRGIVKLVVGFTSLNVGDV